jgi:hypothetical protein
MTQSLWLTFALCLVGLPQVGLAASVQTDSRRSDLLSAEHTLNVQASARSAPDILTNSLGISISIESPRSGGARWDPALALDFQSASLEEILDSLCAQLSSFEWTLHVSARGAAIAIYPDDLDQTYLSAPLDCSTMTAITIESVLASAYPDQRLRYGNPYTDTTLPFQLIANSHSKPFTPFGEVIRDDEVDLSDLGQTDVRSALLETLLAINVPNLIYNTRWGKDVSDIVNAPGFDEDTLRRLDEEGVLASREFNIQKVFVRQALPSDLVSQSLVEYLSANSPSPERQF